MKREAGIERTLTIEQLVQSGEGGVRVDGKLVLVRGVLPGERVTVRLRRGHPAELLHVETTSPGRLTEPCPYVAACGGCSWQHVPREMQREARLDQLRRALPPALRDIPVQWHASPEPYAYRSRARIVWETHAHHVMLGFRGYHSHDVVDVARCMVLDSKLQEAFTPLREELRALGGAGEASIALGVGGAPVATLRSTAMPDVAGFALPGRLVARGFTGVALYVPGASVPTVAGDPRPVIRAADGLPLWLAPEGFAQANEALNLALVRHVADTSQCAGRTVLELYAGAGNFTVFLARAASRVVAVESDVAAIRALGDNLRTRGIANVTASHGDSAEAARARKADVVVLDPPRGGAHDACLALSARPAKRVVYVSCDPPSLGRDLVALLGAMEVESIAAFEMFPHTPHLETVVTLRRRGRA